MLCLKLISKQFRTVVMNVAQGVCRWLFGLVIPPNKVLMIMITVMLSTQSLQ